MTNVLYKTKMCNYELAGNCRHGSACLHAHTPEELRASPNFEKTKLCRLFQKGLCKMTNCSRAHGEQELRRLDQFYKKKLCKYWAEQGSCIRGSDCYFAHSAPEMEGSQPNAFLLQHSSAPIKIIRAGTPPQPPSPPFVGPSHITTSGPPLPSCTPNVYSLGDSHQYPARSICSSGGGASFNQRNRIISTAEKQVLDAVDRNKPAASIVQLQPQQGLFLDNLAVARPRKQVATQLQPQESSCELSNSTLSTAFTTPRLAVQFQTPCCGGLTEMVLQNTIEATTPSLVPSPPSTDVLNDSQPLPLEGNRGLCLSKFQWTPAEFASIVAAVQTQLPAAQSAAKSRVEEKLSLSAEHMLWRRQLEMEKAELLKLRLLRHFTETPTIQNSSLGPLNRSNQQQEQSMYRNREPSISCDLSNSSSSTEKTSIGCPFPVGIPTIISGPERIQQSDPNQSAVLDLQRTELETRLIESLVALTSDEQRQQQQQRYGPNCSPRRFSSLSSICSSSLGSNSCDRQLELFVSPGARVCQTNPLYFNLTTTDRLKQDATNAAAATDAATIILPALSDSNATKHSGALNNPLNNGCSVSPTALTEDNDDVESLMVSLLQRLN